MIIRGPYPRSNPKVVHRRIRTPRFDVPTGSELQHPLSRPAERPREAPEFPVPPRVRAPRFHVRVLQRCAIGAAGGLGQIVEPGDYVSGARTVEVIRACQPQLVREGLIWIQPLTGSGRSGLPALEYTTTDCELEGAERRPETPGAPFARSEVRGSFAEMARRRR